MNPVGIEFLTTVTEKAESSSTSPVGQGANEGEFLSQFLGMLFADPMVDAESTGQFSSTPEEDQESLSLFADMDEGSTGVLGGSDSGEFENDTKTLPKVEALSEESVWVAPAEDDEVANDNPSKASPSTTRLEVVPSQERLTKGDSISFQKENESTPLSSRETDRNNQAHVIEADEKTVAVRNAPVESVEVSEARDASENRESQLRAAVTERSRPGGFVSEVKTTDRTSDPVRTGFELGNPRSRQQVAAPVDQTPSPSVLSEQERLRVGAPGLDTSPPAARVHGRLPITPPAWVPEREGLVQEARDVPSEARKTEVDFAKAPTAAADLGAQMQQNESRNQPETDRQTRDEQLLRRLVVSRTSGQVEENRAAARETEPAGRFQVEPERSVNGTSRPANSEAAQPLETSTAARPDTGVLQGNQGLTLHAPQPAREMVSLHRTEDFDRIADQIVRRMSLSQKGETFQLGVRLKPEFLGEVRIETIMEADRSIRAVIHVEDSSVKALLEGKVSALVQRFDEAGIHVDKVEVQTLPTDVGSGNDTSRQRKGLGYSENDNSAHRVASELGDGLEADSAEEIDDGHIHLFI